MPVALRNAKKLTLQISILLSILTSSFIVGPIHVLSCKYKILHQKTVIVYLENKQLLLFGFVR